MRFNKLIPELVVTNLAKSLRFYKDILGFKVMYNRLEDKFAFLSFNGAQIMIQQENKKWATGKLEHPFGRGVNFQIEVKSIKPLLKRLKSRHYALFEQPKDNFYRCGNKLLGNREFLVQDPDGYLLRFCEDLGSK